MSAYTVFHECDWRLHVLHKARLKPRGIATPQFIGQELLYLVSYRNIEVLRASVMSLIGGGLFAPVPHRVVSSLSGNKLVKLWYPWNALMPHLHLAPRRLSDEILTTMAEPGWVFRAQIFAIRHAKDWNI